MSEANGEAEAAPEPSERFRRSVASGICLGYRDTWIATRFYLTVAQVKAAKARDDFQPYLDAAEIEHQVQMRGRQRRVARLTLKALERLRQADDLSIGTRGIENVLRLGKLGLLPNEDDDEGGGAPAMSPGAAGRDVGEGLDGQVPRGVRPGPAAPFFRCPSAPPTT
jgi:hypothetical protein